MKDLFFIFLGTITNKRRGRRGKQDVACNPPTMEDDKGGAVRANAPVADDGTDLRIRRATRRPGEGRGGGGGGLGVRSNVAAGGGLEAGKIRQY